MEYQKPSFLLSPSDLVNFLGCKHLIDLERKVALGELEKPEYYDPNLALLQQKGQEHEDAYTSFLKSQGKSVYEVPERSTEATIKAMEAGYDVITQAHLAEGNFRGRADYLIKKDGESKFGNYYYEIEDTKLALNTKAGTILQLCLYTELLGKYQKKIPEFIHVVKPGTDFPKETYRFADFEAYYHLVKKQLENVLATEPQPTYPIPVEKCGTCNWWKECDDKRHEDDHLSLIAGARTTHVKELELQGITALEKYALEKEPIKEKPQRGNAESYKKLHSQAKIQSDGRKEKKIIHRLLPIEAKRGLNRLPKLTPGDIYFDIEGDHFYDDGGMEYLLGYVVKNSTDKYEYYKLWAKSRTEEKQAFIEFMKFVLKQWEKHPDFYIYHYAPYEPSAIKRLSTRHAVMENEVDMLLRAERFVDLHSVLKESLQASVEGYSLKDVEKLTDYSRKANLQLSSAARRRMATALQLKVVESMPEDDLQIIELYNADDCYATLELHKFLENIYQEESSKGADLQRPELKHGEIKEEVSVIQKEIQKLFDALTKGLDPDEKENWNEEEKGRWLLAHQIEYFRREEKNEWWEFFRLNDADPIDLFDERKAISGLVFLKEIKEERKIKTHRYSFPAQEISLEEGAELHEVKGEKVGTIVAIDAIAGWVDIKKMKKTNDLHPYAVHCKDMINKKALVASLRAFIESVLDHGINGDGPYRAGRDLLLKNPPRLLNEETLLAKPDEKLEETAIRIVTNLDHSILPIQGPPGTGKTYTGGALIAELVSKGKKVGVTAISHKVIRNLLNKTVERGEDKGIKVTIRHQHSSGDPDDPVIIPKGEDINTFLDEGAVVGGTSWLWARDDYQEKLDYLFVDEAGQMSLCNVLAVCRAAKNIILLGDSQQLEQPQKGAHPEGADISALEHLLDGKQTISPAKGLFLNTTWRLNPKIAEFTSQVYYEGRLKAKEGLEVQEIKGDSPFKGSGLFYLPVEHAGNQNKSIEEIEETKKVVTHLLNSGLTWTNRTGDERQLKEEDILIVAPYNAQVNALKEELPGLSIGTVDKFQGQEAPVVIYSMTSSSPEDAPRGMSFLYSPNRFNVAISRAKCICILVASPTLFEPECHSIEQMKWANGLCRYIKIAKKAE
jgi:predicted RecB family nuclease